MGDAERHPSDARQRPIPEQVAAVRHDVHGIQTSIALLNDLMVRMTTRIENVEAQQSVLQAQMASLSLTPEAVRLVVEEVMERRADEAREERRRDIINAFGRARTIALYITAIGQAVMMLAALWYLVMGNPL